MAFRAFHNETEEQLAAGIIAGIDQGEKWIVQGAEGSSDFGGFIDRLFFQQGDRYGTYSACIYGGRLRLDLGFNADMPDDVGDELLWLIKKARRQVNTFTGIWYPPDNAKLGTFLSSSLPWQVRGHKTHELTFKRGEGTYNEFDLPQGVEILPYEDPYLLPLCVMLDQSLAHTFDDPGAGIFLRQKDQYGADWLKKAKTQDCCIMLDHNELVGAYIVKEAEIDFIAIACSHQGRGLGRYLLHHAKAHIFALREKEPYLYCIDRNPHALRFYLREGMKITGYSGYAFLEKIESCPEQGCEKGNRRKW